MKCKVAHLTSVHPPFDVRIFHKEAKSLVRAGYDVVLIAPGDGDVIRDGIKIRAVPKSRNRIERFTRTIWQVLAKAVEERADVYHFHDPELLIVGVLLKLLLRRKVIYDVHENVFQDIPRKLWIPWYLRLPTALAHKLVTNVCISFIDGLVLAVDSEMKYWEGRIREISIVRNFELWSGEHMESIYDVSLDAHARDQRLELVYVGSVTEARGIREMLTSLHLLITQYGRKDAVLVVIGPVERDVMEQCDALIHRFGLTENVIWKGQLPHEAIYTYLRRARVGLAILHPHPNFVQGLPTKLFEYMAVAVPVIASDFPLWRSIVEGVACGLLVDPLDPKAIAEAVEYVLMHPEEARAMGQRGRQAVQRHYNWPSEERRLLQLYARLTGDVHAT